MNPYSNLFIIGLTGGIGSGKSTVAKIFEKLGAKVIHADRIAHNVLKEPSVKKAITEVFGEEILDTQGGIHRKKLGDLVFSDAKRLEKLNQILHPIIRERIIAKLETWNKEKSLALAREKKVVLLDVPLLLESPLKKICDKILFIQTPLEKRIQLVQSRGWDAKELLRRENFQIPLEKKKEAADLLLDNSSDYHSLESQVVTLWNQHISNEIHF